MRVEPHDGISALIRETPWSSLFPSTRCGHGGKVLAMTRRTQPADDHAGTLILGFQPPQLRNKSPLFLSPLGQWHFVTEVQTDLRQGLYSQKTRCKATILQLKKKKGQDQI